jgi:hypothetical protein
MWQCRENQMNSADNCGEAGKKCPGGQVLPFAQRQSKTLLQANAEVPEGSEEHSQ